MEAENDGRMGEKMTDEERQKKPDAEPVAWQQTIDDAKDFIFSVIVGKESRCRADDVWNRLNEIIAPPRPETGPVAWRSTPAMRTRIRELARPDSDDYDRAVIAVLDDFENIAAIVQSDAEPVAWQLVPKIPTEEMVEAHFAAHARAKTMFAEVPEIWKAMLDVAPAPPRPDVSAGLIEAAEIADKSAKYHQQQYNLVNTVKQHLISSSKARVAEEIAKNIRSRVVNRNAK